MKGFNPSFNIPIFQILYYNREGLQFDILPSIIHEQLKKAQTENYQ